MIRAFSLFFLIMGSLFSTRAGDGIKVGDPIPPLTVPDQDGKPFDLAAYGSHGLLLVFFYPKANTPGCTAQACSLRDANTELTQKGVRIVGVSADQPDSQKEFITKQKLPYPLLADHDGKMIKAFGVEGIAFGFAKRSAFLFRDGKLVWRDPKGSTSDQGETVLKAIESLPRP